MLQFGNRRKFDLIDVYFWMFKDFSPRNSIVFVKLKHPSYKLTQLF